jgi:hypothetical protein
MKSLIYKTLVLFTGLIVASPAISESLVNEGFRELEELRLRQLQTVKNDGDIAPFTSDGCSGGQSQNWDFLAKLLPGFNQHFGNKPPWEACCVTHDKAYWRGDTVDGYLKRKQADIALMQCVMDTGEKMAPQLSVKYGVSEERIRQSFLVTADLMYKAVRVGGQPCSLLPWRWGYGWDNCATSDLSDINENQAVKLKP